jgi:hypothetical protein
MGLDPVPDYLPPYESAEASPELAARYPLAMISPPARHFLNSTFNVESLRSTEGEPHLDIHPADAARAASAMATGARLQRPRLDAGRREVTDRARGLVVGLVDLVEEVVRGRPKRK